MCIGLLNKNNGILYFSLKLLWNQPKDDGNLIYWTMQTVLR